ncbi:hypothetical protein D3C81_1005520 [compost metagenome]
MAQGITGFVERLAQRQVHPFQVWLQATQDLLGEGGQQVIVLRIWHRLHARDHPGQRLSQQA